MKALQITKYGELKDGLAIDEAEVPTVGANDVLVEVQAAGLNPIDYKLVSGGLKDMVPLDLPSAIGFDVCGRVVEKGIEVKGIEVGDAVYARVPQGQMGTVAEYVAVDSSVLSKKPENISFHEAAGLPLVGLTSIQALERVGIQKDDKVLIHAGSGGVGSFAIQYAKAKGAYVLTTTSTKNIDWVKALGADRVIDYTKEDYTAVASGIDLVFDTLGDDYTVEAFQVIKKGGKVTSIAGAPDEETAAAMGMKDYELPEPLANAIAEKEATYKLTWMQPDGDQLDTISEMIKNESIEPVVDKVYAFDDAVDAYTYLSTGRAKGKVIVSFT